MMSRSLMAAAVLAVICAQTLAQQPAADDPAVLKERIRQLEKRVQELEGRLANTPSVPVVPGGPNREALSQIVLKENPSYDDVVDYVAAINDATTGQMMFSPNDPQVAMLVKVGESNIPTLIELGRTRIPFYVVEAIKRLATEQSKQLIITSVADFPDLAGVILAKRWVPEAREELLAVLRNRMVYVSPAVIQAIASLRDPSTYPDLVDTFVTGPNRMLTYQYLAGIPGLDLGEGVARAWEIVKQTLPEGDWERLGMAALACEYGQVDALVEIVSAVRKQGAAGFDPQMRMRVLGALPGGVTLANAVEWVSANREKITFDPKTRRFSDGTAAAK